jgi:hypothetical protein
MDRKTCFKCGEVKSLSAFYKHPQMADGRVNKCKGCNKKDVRENRKDNIDYYRAYDRDRGNRQSREYRDAWEKNNPIKKAASTMVGNAVRDGKIAKPGLCECCGSEPKRLHGHHDDYAFPLTVRWMCPGCHSQWHKLNGEGSNAR